MKSFVEDPWVAAGLVSAEMSGVSREAEMPLETPPLPEAAVERDTENVTGEAIAEDVS